MNKAQNLLRSVAASVIACGVAIAPDASAHAQHFNSLTNPWRRTTSSSGVVVISAERPGAFSCTATYNVARMGSGAGDDPTALEDAPATLTAFLRNANVDRPSARDVALVARDLQDANVQGSISAGCEPGIFALASPPQPDASTAPEPATWALMILGAAMVGLAARRRGCAAVGG